MTLAAACQRREARQRHRGRFDIAAGRADRRQHGEAVHHPMLAGAADRVIDGFAHHVRRDGAAALCVELGELHGGIAMHAEADDVADAAILCRLGEARVMRIVTIEDGCAAALDAAEDFGLRIGDRLDRGEEAKMRRLDCRDHRDMRPDHARQRIDLAGMVHARSSKTPYSLSAAMRDSDSGTPQ